MFFHFCEILVFFEIVVVLLLLSIACFAFFFDEFKKPTFLRGKLDAQMQQGQIFCKYYAQMQQMHMCIRRNRPFSNSKKKKHASFG